jgi:hypothetical protein
MSLSIVGGTAVLNALNTLFNNGTLTIYSGSIPTTPETSATGTSLVTFTFSGTAFAAPVHSAPNMAATANFVAANMNPTASGTAGYARAFESNGTTVLGDYTVSATSGTDIVLGSTTISLGVPVDMSSFTQTMPVV